jgi:Cd2+/Zn2+-exporting ATPase
MGTHKAPDHQAPAEQEEHCDHCDHEHGSNRAESISLAVSGVLVGLALLIDWTDALPRRAMIGTALAGMVAGGWFLLPKAWRAFRRFRPDINLLVIVAAIGASIIGEWVEAATVVFLFLA